MDVRCEARPLSEAKCDAVAIFIFQDKSGVPQITQTLSKSLLDRLHEAVSLKDFSAKEGELISFYTEKSAAAPRLLAVGLGEVKKISLEKVRRASAAAAKAAEKMNVHLLGVEFPSGLFAESTAPFTAGEAARAIVEGAVLSTYTYSKYLTSSDEKKKLTGVTVLTAEKKYFNDVAEGVRWGKILSAATCHARDLENAPSNEIYPETLAFDIQETAHRCGFKATVFDQRKIESLKMGGIIGVSKGSSHAPRFVILEHQPAKVKSGTVVLVGKGVTFDSGGISIKPAANMAEMKMDMSGAAAVVGAFQAIAELKLPVHVVGLIPTVENMPSGTAVKPGDIIRHYGGKTSEVDNTDAEGRLILADALGYASHFKPDVVIDLATLTGACVVALGHFATGMMGNDQPTMDALTSAGEATYERVWQLPLFEEYEKLIKSDVADVKNTGGRWGGAITAGLFLKRFIGENKWVHLDIAGTAILEESQDYAPRGGSGVGVRLLVEFLKNRRQSAGA
ncbi:MAG TPA: leucyl aminopeptidase [Bacteroidota bacterium]|nr:leucyl aminopeptidase [Bacteroidota bacterium]